MTELVTNLRRRWGIAMLGVPDFTIDHNTFIINANNPNAYGAYRSSLSNTAYGQGQGSYGNPRPYTPNALPLWCDRATVTHNIFDGNHAVSGTGIGTGAAPAHASDWNVTSGTYSKASTTGGPLGATF